MAQALNLDQIIHRIADVILSLEGRGGRTPGETVLSYVRDAVITDIGHRRRARELARTLAAIERARDGSATEAPATAGPRPSRPGGTLVAAFRSGADPEEAVYRSFLSGRTPVHLRCRDGYEVRWAVLRNADANVLLMDTLEGLELFHKRNILSIATVGTRRHEDRERDSRAVLGDKRVRS